MIQSFKTRLDREKDYTSFQILDLLQSKSFAKPPAQDHSAKISNNSPSFHSFHRYSLDHRFKPKSHNRTMINESTAHSEFPKQNSSSQKKYQYDDNFLNTRLKLIKRPVTSKSPELHERLTFDPSYQKRRVSQKLISLQNIPKQTFQNLFQKTTQSIIFPTTSQTSLQARQNNGVAVIKKPGSTSRKIGQLSNKSFHRIRFLGKGKFGQVHLVMHKETGFICAMKILNKQMIKSEKMQIPISRELKIHNNIQSANIINFYGFFEDEDSLYILIEYAVDGAMLGLLKNRNRLQEEQIVGLIKGISQGVKYMHKNNIIHRDLKPENIVMNFGIPKICDFGWATNCDNFQMCNSYCGTPLYLSPQMIKKEFYGFSVDIWTIGHLTYQLLVGRVAFSIWTENDLEIVLKQNVKIPQYIDRSPECEDFIIKALQKNVDKRLTITEILRHKFLNQQQKNYEHKDFSGEAERLILDF